MRRNIGALVWLEVDKQAEAWASTLTRWWYSYHFIEFGEIMESVDNLHNIAVYIRRFPYARLGVEKGAFLRYHVENYLNELYILQKRMEAYLTAISRMYKLDPRSSPNQTGDQGNSGQVASAFLRHYQGTWETVHRKRYTE